MTRYSRKQYRALPPSIGRTDAESHFEDKVDANFPVHDLPACYRLMHEGLKISPGVCYALMYELCMGRIAKKDRRRQAKMIRHLQAHMQHPVKDMVSDTALIALYNKPHSLNLVIDKIQQLRPHSDAFYALQVIANSYEGPDIDDDDWERLDNEHDKLMLHWRKKPVT